MKFSNIKTTKDFYYWSMLSSGFHNWLLWEQLDEKAKKWWADQYVKVCRERWEKGIKDDLDY